MKKLAIILTAFAVSLSAGSFTIQDEARVTHSKPIYKTVTKKIPYQECWDEQVPVRRGRYSSNDDYLGPLIGGAAGGIIGNQIGGGSGKTVATVGGAILGTIVGSNLSKGDRYYDEGPRYVTKQRCSTRYHSEDEEKFVGYKNIANYKGKKIVKISQRKLRYIPIDITVRY
jgi:uncharacterized protein YcfJ